MHAPLTLPGIERRSPPTEKPNNDSNESSDSAEELNPFFLPKHLDHELPGYNVSAAPTATRVLVECTSSATASASSTSGLPPPMSIHPPTEKSSYAAVGYPSNAAACMHAPYNPSYPSVLPDPTMESRDTYNMQCQSHAYAPNLNNAYALPSTCRSEVVNYQQPPPLEPGEMQDAVGHAFLPDPTFTTTPSNAILPLSEEGLLIHQQHVLFAEHQFSQEPPEIFADIPLPEDIVADGEKTLTQALTEVAREESKKPSRKEYSHKEHWEAYQRYVEVVPEEGRRYIERHPAFNLYCNMCDKAFDPGHAESQQHTRNLVNYGFTDSWVVFEGDDWVTGAWVIRPWPMSLEDGQIPQALMTQVPIAPWLMAKVSPEEMNARATMFAHQQAMASYYASQQQHMGQPNTCSNVSTAYQTLPDPVRAYDAPDPLAGIPAAPSGGAVQFDNSFATAGVQFNAPPQPAIPAVPMPDPLEGYAQQHEEQQLEEQRRVQQMLWQQQQQHANTGQESLPDPLAGASAFTMPSPAAGMPGMGGGAPPPVGKSVSAPISTGFKISTEDDGFKAIEDNYMVMGLRAGQYVGQNNGGVIKKERNEWVLNYRSVTVAVAPAVKDKKAPPTEGWVHQSQPAPFKVSILIPDGKGGFLGSKG